MILDLAILSDAAAAATKATKGFPLFFIAAPYNQKSSTGIHQQQQQQQQRMGFFLESFVLHLLRIKKAEAVAANKRPSAFFLSFLSP